ncbi:hypothetical protein VOLCADRAFT_89739 [Volvox carteri f. nagariensis]|uniref:Uncharacterized protein n=1 Tax=Volvox carteri f. nagariensis TaxID=3068 RepID=D8TSI4_VOLCA|nr:uncharacterized protein VOLCADRAFT_89739 [Volvox carteri f. nagariensis]EFJ49492.1 hypothetical protein VOLCADRAFT_89739 [Volvox carteri f. nagariensis]|eukprot:XP_002949473.1 hypothetical protein VOLCADRAFT_89739 [Volvox carteri f. nagariensis]
MTTKDVPSLTVNFPSRYDTAVASQRYPRSLEKWFTSAASTKSKKAPGLTKASDGADDEPSISGRAEEGREKQRQEEGCDGNVNGGSAPAAFAVKGANPFTEQFVQKKLKDRKKEYLKRKAEKKRRKGTGGQVVVEKELQLKDHVKFGEVHLKRKHWAEKEKTANERCKEVFLKQMQQAQQQIAAGAAARTDDGIAMRKGGGGKGGKAAKGADGDSAQQNRKRKAPMDAETEELRQQVIESYRAAKKGTGFHNSTVGQATLASLSHLVGKSAGAKAASTAGGGKKTHTLA